MADDNKWCVNCKWYSNNIYTHGWAHTCYSPKLGTNVVTGKPNLSDCQHVRYIEGECGPDGVWFERKIV